MNDSESMPTGIFLDVISGTSHGWSVYLNGKFLGSTFGSVSLPQTNCTLYPSNKTKAGENVLFVIQDNMGHDQTTGVLNPRGILNTTLQVEAVSARGESLARQVVTRTLTLCAAPIMRVVLVQRDLVGICLVLTTANGRSEALQRDLQRLAQECGCTRDAKGFRCESGV